MRLYNNLSEEIIVSIATSDHIEIPHVLSNLSLCDLRSNKFIHISSQTQYIRPGDIINLPNYDHYLVYIWRKCRKSSLALHILNGLIERYQIDDSTGIQQDGDIITVYESQHLSILNRTSSKLSVQLSADRNNVIRTVESGRTLSLPSNISTSPLLNLTVDNGSSVYRAVIQPIDMKVVSSSPSALMATWDESDTSLTITDSKHEQIPSDDRYPVGQNCNANSDCTSDSCLNGLCVAANLGGPCLTASDCISMNCNMGFCGPSSVGGKCNINSDCTSGLCYNNLCSAVELDALCVSNLDCVSGACSSNQCVKVPVDFPCMSSEYCISNNCVRGQCRPCGYTLPIESNTGQIAGWIWIGILIIIGILVIILITHFHRRSRTSNTY